MDDREIKRLGDNLSLFVATYVAIERPNIPSYDDGEETWVQFIKPAVEAYFNKQRETLKDYVFSDIEAKKVQHDILKRDGAARKKHRRRLNNGDTF